MVPHGSHMAPMWIIRLPQATIHLPCGTIWSPYGAHGSNMAHIWISRSTFGSHLPYGSHTVHSAPIWCMWLLCGICSSHTVHASPILCTRLPYSTHGSHIEHSIWCHMPPTWCHQPPIWHTQLPPSTLSFHMAPICRVLPPDDAILLTNVVSAPIWCMWLPYSTCGSNMV
jgi:hypothetical protein